MSDAVVSKRFHESETSANELEAAIAVQLRREVGWRVSREAYRARFAPDRLLNSLAGGTFGELDADSASGDRK